MTDKLKIPHEADQPVAVEFSEDMLKVTLKDGRLIATPLAWYPTLVKASAEQRSRYEMNLRGIHWPDLDEDLSIDGLLSSNHPPRRKRKAPVCEG